MYIQLGNPLGLTSIKNTTSAIHTPDAFGAMAIAADPEPSSVLLTT